MKLSKNIVYLHIGLPKTATTFLQSRVFCNFDKKEILYNPEDVVGMLLSYFNYGDDHALIEELINKLIHLLSEKYVGKKLLISNEGLSLDHWSADYKRMLEFNKRVFPNAIIILWLRFQPSWLVSFYKQSVHQGYCQKFDDFFMFKNGDFQKHETKPTEPHIFPYELDYPNMLNAYIDAFGRENVRIYFFEDFVCSPKTVVESLCSLMGVTNYTSDYSICYSALSNLSVRLSLLYNKLTGIGAHKRYSASPPAKDSIFSRVAWLIRFCFSWCGWRLFLKHGIEKIIRADGKKLYTTEMREKLEKYFYQDNKKLLQYFSEDELPRQYLDKELN